MITQTPETPNRITSGEMITVDSIASIEKVLEEMWKVASDSLPQTGSGEKAYTRISLGNLIVVTDEKRLAEILEILERLSVRRPSRVLVIELKTKGGPPGIRASIHAVCHRPSPGAPQVCCEQIRLECDDESLNVLPAVVASLLEPDLPAVLWWDRDLTVHEQIFLQLAEELGSVVFDLDSAKRYDRIRDVRRKMPEAEVYDLAWTRIEPWRRALARVFDEEAMKAFLPAINRVEIKIKPGEFQDEILRTPAVGLLYLGWLAAQLQWKITAPLHVENEGMKATLAGPAGEVHFELNKGNQAESDSLRASSLEAVVLRGNGTTKVQLEQLSDKGTVGVSIECADSCPLNRRVAAVSPTADQILGDVLESAIHTDPIFVKALDQALGLLGL